MTSRGAATHCQNQDAQPEQRRFDSHWNEADVRGALLAMQGGTCAYCSRTIAARDRGDVDHFRPKGRVREDPTHGGYWWLAYSFDNYLHSCKPCNQDHKGNQFPMRPRGRHLRYQDTRRLAREARLLLDPCADPVDEWLQVTIPSPDDAHELVKLIPSPTLAKTAQGQVSATARMFRWNLDVDLLCERREVLDAVLSALDDGRDHDARELAVRYQRHSLVARSVLERCRPALLPSPSEEFDWLLGQLVERLYEILELLERCPGGDTRNERDRDEIGWALAVLWADPPAGTPEAVEAFLTAQSEDLREWVRSKRDALVSAAAGAA